MICLGRSRILRRGCDARLGGKSFISSFSKRCSAHIESPCLLVERTAMATKSTSTALRNAFAAVRPRPSSSQGLRTCVRQRGIHQQAKIPAITSSQARHRPVLQPSHQSTPISIPNAISGSRSIFIQTQTTPNADASTPVSLVEPAPNVDRP